MSRGLGSVQRELVAMIGDSNGAWVPAVTLIGPGATRSRVESVYRALRTLHQRGVVERSGLGYRIAGRQPRSGSLASDRQLTALRNKLVGLGERSDSEKIPKL